MLSIVISSKIPSMLAKVGNSIKSTVGVNYEIISIPNHGGEMGICKAYNIGAARARYDYLCFCHEDILFHTNGWGSRVLAHLSDYQIGLIGVVGCIVKPKAPSGAWIGGFNVNRVQMLQGVTGEDRYIKYENPMRELISDVVVIDGLWMCCRRSVWECCRFDETLLKGFHGYDIDFSLQIQKQFRLCVVYDILIEHASNGGNSVAWAEAALKVHKKWARDAPVCINMNSSISELQDITYCQWLIFLDALNSFDYPVMGKLRYWLVCFGTRFHLRSAAKYFIKAVLGHHVYTKLSSYRRTRI